MEQKPQTTAESNIPKNETQGSINFLENKTTAELFEIIRSAERELEEIQIEKKNLLEQSYKEAEASSTTITNKEKTSPQPDNKQENGAETNAEQELILLKAESKQLEEEIVKIEDYIETLGSIWKNRKERGKQKENLEGLILKLKIIERKVKVFEEIIKDRKEKPFTYFAFEKCTNKILLDTYTDEFTGLIDLRTINKNQEDIRLLISENRNERKGDVVFQFNIFGFIEMANNINKFVNTESSSGGVILNSEIYSDKNKIWKIIGPDGDPITPDYVNASEAKKIYKERTTERREKLINEFESTELNSLKTKEEKIQYLNERRKRKINQVQSINNIIREIKNIVPDSHLYPQERKTLEEEEILKKERAERLSALEKSPIDYIKNEINKYNNNDNEEIKTKRETLKKILQEIEGINKEYDEKIAKLEE